ncbi:MAG: hypothetical protein AVDCRST_MAG43-744 [uncultured Thermomicrobiales bacterium]|uniref:Uncharacterized protein n=1 Tax=uncultured Thermomicrobiales bacterium TaxID=1645740 RepID=A0A6J4UEI2_9BACT|nr:MAG: hypothetical protein AVDCRST_MAG43-744 [uncultured Thermomicrobiales bacterium]
MSTGLGSSVMRKPDGRTSKGQQALHHPMSLARGPDDALAGPIVLVKG